MQMRPMGGVQVPVVGMGTYVSFDVTSAKDIQVRREIIDRCIESCSTFVDTSPMYGNAERVLGATTQGQREKLQLATKVWCQGRQEGERQIARSFELMQTDYIDVLQVHNLRDWDAHLSTLELLKERGKIGLIGVTHNTPTAYPEIMRIMRSGRIDTIQVPYNVRQRACEDELLPLAEELGIGVIVMEPLQKGRYVTGLSRRPDLGPLGGFGIRTWAQALLAWVVADSRVSVAIPATSRPSRIAENARAGAVDTLPNELREYIRHETERCL